MKTLLAATLAALLASTAAMVATRPAPGRPGRVPLVWVTDQNPTRTDEMAHFTRRHPGIDLTLDPGNTDTQKVIVQAQAGVGPDLFDYWGEAAKNAYVKSGIAWDVTDALRARGLDPKRIVWPLALPWTTIGGRTYAIPANVGVDAIWLREDLFAGDGVPLPKSPWSLDDLVRTAQAMTKRGRRGKIERYGFLTDFRGFWNAFLPAFGGDLFDPKGHHCTVADPASVACLRFDRDLIYRWHVSPSPNDEQSITAGGGWGGAAGPQAYFRRGIGAMEMGGGTPATMVNARSPSGSRRWSSSPTSWARTTTCS